MKQIISIDENSRIIIESENYILEYRRKSKSKISWRVAGYFPDLVSSCLDYLNNAPRGADNAIKDINGIVVAIQIAETRICKIINNNKQLYGRDKKSDCDRNGKNTKKRAS